MEDNGIRRLSHLSSLPALRCLQLGGNRVLDMVEVLKLAGATSVVDLSLAGCPISRKAGYRTAVLMRLEHVQVRPCPSGVMDPWLRRMATLAAVIAGGAVPTLGRRDYRC